MKIIDENGAVLTTEPDLEAGSAVAPGNRKAAGRLSHHLLPGW